MRAGADSGDMVPKIDAPSRRCQLFANETMACRCYALGVYLGGPDVNDCGFAVIPA